MSYRINVPRKSDLELTAHNGGITITGVNGGCRSDIPLTIQGELSSRRGISTQLGSGGPTVRVRTTNGGLKIHRR